MLKSLNFVSFEFNGDIIHVAKPSFSFVGFGHLDHQCNITMY